MLSRAENDVLTRIEAGSPAGEYMRRFWLPALLSSELPDADGTPVRVRLFGEDLVAFRDSGGAVGLLGEQCPHRRASLALGVNERHGLRCLYHGYKFAVDGKCLDAPTELPRSRVADRLHATAYPTVERSGIVWAYLGPEAARPPFPEFTWFGLPAPNVAAFKTLAECNYAQLVEGVIDSAHAGVLHRRTPWATGTTADDDLEPLVEDLSPKLEIEYTPYGFRYGAVRHIGDDQTHVRVTQMILPTWTIIPPGGPGPTLVNRRLANAFVPRDDTTTWHFQYLFDETRPIDVASRIDEGGHWYEPGTFRKARNRDNWYLQDREAMRARRSFAGIEGIVTQDHAVNETQGPILDRSREHLGTSDVAIVGWRRLMLKRIRALAADPDGEVTHADLQAVNSATLKLTSQTRWTEEFPLPVAM